MSQSIVQRLVGLEKQAATLLAATQYPPIPSLAERRAWALQQHKEL